MSLELITIPCLSDNYAFILFNEENRSALLVDAPEAEPINKVINQEKLNLEKIFFEKFGIKLHLEKVFLVILPLSNNVGIFFSCRL